MAKKFVLHIGTEKTGTTSIQNYLWNVRPALEANGWLYSTSLGPGPHIKLTACCLDFSPQAPLLKALGISSEAQFTKHCEKTLKHFQSEVEKSTCENVLLSDEHINVHLSTSSELKRLNALLSQFGSVAKILLYFRRQDHLYMSMKSEALKNSIFFAHNLQHPIHSFHILPYRFNYVKIVENIKTAFPQSQLFVRPYIDSSEFDVLNDFKHALDLEHLPASASTARRNLSLPQSAFHSLVLIGALAANRNETVVLAHWTDILQQVALHFPGPPARLNAAESAQFLDRFQAMNSRLIDVYPQLQLALQLSSSNNALEAFQQYTDIDPLTLCRSIADALPIQVINALEQLCSDLSQANDVYELAFPEEVLERWKTIKQKNQGS